jgi:hypothetical protein
MFAFCRSSPLSLLLLSWSLSLSRCCGMHTCVRIVTFHGVATAGKFSDRNGTANACTDCPLDTFSPVPGSTSCRECSIGAKDSGILIGLTVVTPRVIDEW